MSSPPPKPKSSNSEQRKRSVKPSPSPNKSSSKQKATNPATMYNPAALLTISEAQKNELRRAFDMFDTAGTGRIKAHEVRVAFYALGYDVSQDQLVHLLREVGADATDVLDFNEFFNVLTHKMTRKEPRMESVRAFKQMDNDEKGYISLKDLREISDSLNMNLTDDELVEMLLFAHPTAFGAPAGGSSEFEAKESLAVPEAEFLKLMKRANVY